MISGRQMNTLWRSVVYLCSRSVRPNYPADPAADPVASRWRSVCLFISLGDRSIGCSATRNIVSGASGMWGKGTKTTERRTCKGVRRGQDSDFTCCTHTGCQGDTASPNDLRVYAKPNANTSKRAECLWLRIYIPTCPNLFVHPKRIFNPPCHHCPWQKWQTI